MHNIPHNCNLSRVRESGQARSMRIWLGTDPLTPTWNASAQVRRPHSPRKAGTNRVRFKRNAAQANENCLADAALNKQRSESVQAPTQHDRRSLHGVDSFPEREPSAVHRSKLPRLDREQLRGGQVHAQCGNEHHLVAQEKRQADRPATTHFLVNRSDQHVNGIFRHTRPRQFIFLISIGPSFSDFLFRYQRPSLKKCRALHSLQSYHPLCSGICNLASNQGVRVRIEAAVPPASDADLPFFEVLPVGICISRIAIIALRTLPFSQKTATAEHTAHQ